MPTITDTDYIAAPFAAHYLLSMRLNCSPIFSFFQGFALLGDPSDHLFGRLGVDTPMTPLSSILVHHNNHSAPRLFGDPKRGHLIGPRARSLCSLLGNARGLPPL